MSGNEIENVAAIACRTIRPQTRLLAVQHHLEAVARAAQHITDQELAPALLAGREQCEQHRGKAREQVGTQCFTFAVTKAMP